MHRFFVAPESIDDEDVILTGSVAGRLERVLRMRPGDHIVVLDDSARGSRRPGSPCSRRY